MRRQLDVARIAIALALLSLILGWTAAAFADESPLVGMPLPIAQKTDFFTFFHLVKIGERDGFVEFKPSGGTFRDLVTVRARLDGDRIKSMQLVLSRSFVDDKKNGIFARDIARSFLRGALSAPDQQANAALIEWIDDRRGYGGISAEPAKVPSSPQPDTYLVYLGKQARAANGKVTLSNAGATLVIDVR